MEQVIIIPAQEWQAHLQRLEKLELEQLISNMLLGEQFWIPAKRIMGYQLPNLRSFDGIKSAGLKGELVLELQKNKTHVSAKSFADYLRRQGYSADFIKDKLVA